jgi:pimeloyl-ACP methyl ester carboxylesterase
MPTRLGRALSRPGSGKPVKVLWGRRDPYLPIELARTFGTGDVEILDGIGHWPPAEAPAVVADRLRGFVAGSKCFVSRS